MDIDSISENPIQLSSSDWRCLLEIARHSIKYGLTYHIAPQLDLDKYSENVNQLAASFVTLKESSVLRGCIGSVEPRFPLVQDVANHAFAAAFLDKRFASINHIEEPVVHISISVVSNIHSLDFKSESQLVKKLGRFNCGIILYYEDRKATFLPEIWQQVSNEVEFLNRLKLEF